MKVIIAEKPSVAQAIASVVGAHQRKEGYLMGGGYAVAWAFGHLVGLAMPETMQCALNECGTFRILVASAVGAVGKLFRQKGWFYKVAGYKASAVDGPCSFTLPPYDHYVVPAPDQPNETAAKLSKVLDGALVLIIDLNDIGGRILGSSDPNADLYLEVLRQNPLGQSREQTPMGVIRPVSE